MIKVGDLVMVVHTHCPAPGLGHIYTVERIECAGPRRFICFNCDAKIEDRLFARFGNHCCPLSWLKRIDPPSEVEFTKTERELTV